MDGSLHTVVHFKVQLWELVFLVGRGFLNITEGRGIHNVADDETRDGLILGDGLSSRDASACVCVWREREKERWMSIENVL
jgi:hypothetical protein